MNVKASRILWPTDFSELSRKGGAYARALTETFAAELHILHVCQPLMASTVGLPLAPEMTISLTQNDLLGAAAARLSDFAEREFRDVPKPVRAVRLGVPWQEICRYAESEQIDLIIIGTHGYTGVRHVLIGSVAERVVRHAHCPVLTVKASERDFVQS